jgi:hypothetical protein
MSNSITIRLEIQIPTGATGAGDLPICQTSVAQGRGADGPVHVRSYTSISPPNSSTGRWSVLPVNGTGLGTICAEVTYGQPQANVWAAVYPALLFPSSPPPNLGLADWKVLGQPANNNTVWRWRTTNTLPNAVKGAAHEPAPGWAPNKLGIWHQVTTSDPIVFEGGSDFLGVTDNTPCGSISGSGLAPPWAAELLAADILMVSVGDGPYTGRHYAKRAAPREWVAEVGAERWVISVSTTWNLSFGVGERVLASKVVSAHPFTAVFPGKVAGAKADVVVTVA